MIEIISKFHSSHNEVESTHVTVHILCRKLASVHICGRSVSTNWTNFLCLQIRQFLVSTYVDALSVHICGNDFQMFLSAPKTGIKVLKW